MFSARPRIIWQIAFTAPSLHDQHVARAACDQLPCYLFMDTYERTYSLSLGLPSQPSTSSDHAIARALAEDAPAPGPDTSLDLQLALQLHEQEAQKLVRAPSKRARQHDRRIKRLLKSLNITKVIPRLNPSYHPNDTYVSSDRQRLLLRLDMYALQERQITGDGNCQFRAIADQLYFRQDLHGLVRQQVVAQLCKQPEQYKPFVATDYQQYINSMSKPGTWGDHITLQAAADAFSVRICIVSSFLDNCVISIHPNSVPEQDQQTALQDVHQEMLQQQQQQQQLLQKSSSDVSRTLWLAFWAEVHYNSLAPKASEGPSASEASEEDERSISSASNSSTEGDNSSDKLWGSRKLRKAAETAATIMGAHNR